MTGVVNALGRDVNEVGKRRDERHLRVAWLQALVTVCLLHGLTASTPSSSEPQHTELQSDKALPEAPPNVDSADFNDHLLRVTGSPQATIVKSLPRHASSGAGEAGTELQYDEGLPEPPPNVDGAEFDDFLGRLNRSPQAGIAESSVQYRSLPNFPKVMPEVGHALGLVDTVANAQLTPRRRIVEVGKPAGELVVQGKTAQLTLVIFMGVLSVSALGLAVRRAIR